MITLEELLYTKQSEEITRASSNRCSVRKRMLRKSAVLCKHLKRAVSLKEKSTADLGWKSLWNIVKTCAIVDTPLFILQQGMACMR